MRHAQIAQLEKGTTPENDQRTRRARCNRCAGWRQTKTVLRRGNGRRHANDANVWSTPLCQTKRIGGRGTLMVGRSRVLVAMLLLVSGLATRAYAQSTCVPPASGLVAWWAGDSNANDVLHHDGTLAGTTTFATGKVAQAFSFDGGGSVDIAYSTVATPHGITVMAWANPAATVATASIFNWRPISGASGVSLETSPSDGSLTWSVRANGAPSVVAVSSGVNHLPVGSWTHVAGTYDGTTTTLYLNGFAVGSSTTTFGALSTIAADAKIGENIVTGALFDGLIDEVQMFDHALSVADIQAVYAADTHGTCKDIVMRNGFEPVGVPGVLADFAVSAPASANAGTPVSFTLTARDAFGDTINNYTGTVHFTSSDPAVAFAASDYTFTLGDAGVHTANSGVMFKTAGAQTVTATDALASISGTSNSVIVAAGMTTHLTVAAPSTAVSSSPVTLTVSAVDAFGNVTPGYRGTVHVSGSDAQASLPTDHTFTAADAGTHAFANGLVMKTVGVQFIAAIDTVASLISGQSGAIVVVPGPATSLTVVSPNFETAGVAGPITVTAKDAAGNVATNYSGTVHYTSSLPTGLPADHTFTSGDAGTFTTTALFETAGFEMITVTDTVNATLTGTTSNIIVTAGPTASFEVTSPNPVTHGGSFSLTVVARDQFFNTSTSYSGTVHFTSTDPLATLPAQYTFSGGDNGGHTFSVTLGTPGSQTITVTDTVTAALTGSQSITVN
jgi:Concanavalin A-like lectin/glucanases superfamily